MDLRGRDSQTSLPCTLQLGPWLAVEIPDLIQKGVIQHKEKSSQ